MQNPPEFMAFLRRWFIHLPCHSSENARRNCQLLHFLPTNSAEDPHIELNRFADLVPRVLSDEDFVIVEDVLSQEGRDASPQSVSG
jgi:hypothetical protein